jgi:hypothetical protein
MVPTSRFIITVSGLVIGGYLNWYFHEYVHWIAGKSFSGDPDVLYDTWHSIPYPHAVEFNRLSKMPNWGIRIAGISPHVLWSIVSVYYLTNSAISIEPNIVSIADSLHSIPFLTLILLSAAVGAGVSVSPSDLVATIYPSKYRDFTGQDLSHRDWLDILVGRVN